MITSPMKLTPQFTYFQPLDYAFALALKWQENSITLSGLNRPLKHPWMMDLTHFLPHLTKRRGERKKKSPIYRGGFGGIQVFEVDISNLQQQKQSRTKALESRGESGVISTFEFQLWYSITAIICLSLREIYPFKLSPVFEDWRIRPHIFVTQVRHINFYWFALRASYQPLGLESQ